MGHGNPANENLNDYQTREQRKQRFLFHSTDSHFYIETLSGKLLMPNEFCAHRKYGQIDQYFLLKRHGQIYVSQTIKMCENGFMFSISKSTGNIYDNFHEIERNIFEAEFIDVETFISYTEKSIQKNFQTFTISLTV